MTNADLFRAVFNGLTATELWAKPESEFLKWLNAEAVQMEQIAKNIDKDHKIVCYDCRFHDICEELEYPMDCTDTSQCKHYDACMEGLEEYD